MKTIALPVSIHTQTSVELNKKLKAALGTIGRKLKKLGVNPNIVYKTNGSFKYNENDSNNIQIFTHAEPNYLAKALGMLRRVKKETEEVYAGMEITTYPTIIWFQYDIDWWIHDLEIRLKIVCNQTKIAELTQAKNELETFMSQEDRLVNTLSKVSNLLK